MIGPTSDQAKARLGPVNAHLSTVSFCILSFETEQLRLPWPSAVEGAPLANLVSPRAVESTPLAMLP